MPYFAGVCPIFYRVYARDGLAADSTILLLHGLGSAGDDWPLQLGPFAERHRLLIPDLRGHGRSETPPGNWGIGEMAADLAALLDHSGGGAVHVVGLSLGGCAGLWLAVERPELVRSLVLVNAFARLQPAGPRGLLRFGQRLWLLAFAPMPALAQVVAGGLFPRPDQREHYERAVARLSANSKASYARTLRALAYYDLRPRLREVRCPTLVIAGDRDLTIPLRAKQRLAQGIPGARLVVVPDSGHATPYDQAESFNRLVLDFLDEQNCPASS
jgi:pimeloyl-ACP methyl ester carboxylesterase